MGGVNPELTYHEQAPHAPYLTFTERMAECHATPVPLLYTGSRTTLLSSLPRSLLPCPLHV